MAVPFSTGEIVTAAEMNELARAHWRKTSSRQVVSTVTETDLLNGEVTIDAGAMSTNRMLRLTASGVLINNSGSTQAAPRFKVKLGATTLLDTNTIAAVWAMSTSSFGWRAVAEIGNTSATSQWSSLDADFTVSLAANSTAAFVTGNGVYAAPTDSSRLEALGVNSSTVDTTVTNALAFTVILPVSNANVSMTLAHASVELI